jgi:hypothetical protein
MSVDDFERRLKASLGPGRTPDEPPVDRLWEHIDSGLSGVPPRRATRWRPLVGIAAAATLVIVTRAYLWPERRGDVTVDAGTAATRKSLAVIDSALARLRPDSQSSERVAAQMVFLAELRAGVLSDFPDHVSGGQGR